MASEAKLFVRSHVARDLLQNAALFKTDKLAVWEYVSNSLQYVDPGTNPVVRVLLARIWIVAPERFQMDRRVLQHHRRDALAIGVAQTSVGAALIRQAFATDLTHERILIAAWMRLPQGSL